MIRSKQDYLDYLEADKIALGMKNRKKLPFSGGVREIVSTALKDC